MYYIDSFPPRYDAYYYVNGRSDVRQASERVTANVTDPLYCYSIMYTHLISALDESRMVASLIPLDIIYIITSTMEKATTSEQGK